MTVRKLTTFSFKPWVYRDSYLKDCLTWMVLINCLQQLIKNRAKNEIHCDNSNFEARNLTTNKKYRIIDESQQNDIKDMLIVWK